MKLRFGSEQLPTKYINRKRQRVESYRTMCGHPEPNKAARLDHQRTIRTLIFRGGSPPRSPRRQHRLSLSCAPVAMRREYCHQKVNQQRPTETSSLAYRYSHMTRGLCRVLSIRCWSCRNFPIYRRGCLSASKLTKECSRTFSRFICSRDLGHDAVEWKLASESWCETTGFAFIYVFCA